MPPRRNTSSEALRGLFCASATCHHERQSAESGRGGRPCGHHSLRLRDVSDDCVYKLRFVGWGIVSAGRSCITWRRCGALNGPGRPRTKRACPFGPRSAATRRHSTNARPGRCSGGSELPRTSIDVSELARLYLDAVPQLLAQFRMEVNAERRPSPEVECERPEVETGPELPLGDWDGRAT